MRTKLFHTIVLCGAALGGAVGCSGGDDSGDKNDKGGGGTHCDPSLAAPIPAVGGAGGAAGGPAGGSDAAGAATAGSDSVGGAATAGSGSVAPCGGWPPTK